MRPLLPEGPPPRLAPILDRAAEWWARRTPRARAILRLATGAALVVVALRPGGQPWGPTGSTWVATHDLLPGHVLGPDDLTRAPWPVALLPAGAPAGGLDDPASVRAELTGRVLAVGLPAGSPVTTWHLQAPGPADRAPPDHVAVALPVDLLPPLPAGRAVDLHGPDGIAVHGALVIEATDEEVWLAIPRAAAGRLAMALAYGELLVGIVAAPAAPP